MPTPCPNDVEHFRDLNTRVRRRRVPFSGSIDLTLRCNLKCIHCYAGPRPPAAEKGELSTDQWLAILGQALDAGCLFLLITGGEPLLREDFATIYTFAKERGFLVTLFTNGTLLTEAWAARLADLPPCLVEISIYGAAPATHDSITGVPGSFAQTFEGVERLLARNVRVGLKTVLMRPNIAEWRGMQAIAEGYKIRFRMDPLLFRRFDGDEAPLRLRVDPTQAAAAEFSDPARRADWREYHERVSRYKISSRLYNCAAGVSNFHVSSSGRIQPCLMTPHIGCDLLHRSFAEGWRKISGMLNRRQAPPDFPCNSCDRRAVCGFCPGYLRLENGDEMRPSEYLCRLGEARLHYIYSGEGS